MTTFSPFSDETLHELSLPLNPDRVSVIPEGPSKGAPYLDGEDVTRRANEVFGFGNWGFELQGLPVLAEKEGNYEVWMAHGRLHVRGAMPTADLGTCVRFGTGHGGLEMAIKGCATDAMKRCLKQLGDQFGLVLYDKTVSAGELRKQWAAATGQPVRSEPRDLAAEAEQVAQATNGGRVGDVEFDAFKGQCKAFNLGASFVADYLGGDTSSPDAALAWLKTKGPYAVQKWIDDNPGLGWNNLVSRLVEKRDAAQARELAGAR